VRPGFDAGHVLTFDLVLPRARYTSEPRVAAYHRDLAMALRGNPNIDAVGAATSTPLDGQDGCDAIWVEGHAFVSGGNPCVDTTQVAPGYFQALRIAIRGRVLDSDMAHGEVVVSESLARRLWPGEDAIGKSLRINGDGPPYYGVVGVAADVRRNGFDKPAAETVYLPIVSRAGAPLRGAPRGMRVVIRTRIANAAAVMPDVRSIVARLDPNVPIANVQTLADAASESMARSSFTTTLLAMAALLAMVLSAVGLYGVIAYGVASRRAELGVRLALGARPVGLRLMVLRETLRLVLAGIGMGIVAALASTRFIAGFLYGVSPHDPATLASVTSVLLCVGLLAGVIPAWRASRVDPLVALRCD
jgi:putative ABC transport system permease protein